MSGDGILTPSPGSQGVHRLVTDRDKSSCMNNSGTGATREVSPELGWVGGGWCREGWVASEADAPRDGLWAGDV